MDTNDLIKKLKELAQADIDTVHTYNRVFDEISDEIVRSRLTEFRDNHINHIAAISEEIRNLGGEPPELTRDFKGYIIEAFAVLGTVVGMKSALKALKTAENITYRYYSQIIPKDLPSPLKERLRKHFSDEKIHLEYIDNNLKVL
ncbi:MAG: ferritin-like domain-containing protein [Desulfobacterales bacterium]